MVTAAPLPGTEVAVAIERFLRVLWRPGDVREVRILKAGRYRKSTHSGCFDDPALVVPAVAGYDGRVNVYVTVNPVAPALLARAANRIVEGAETTTSDADILVRRWLPIDIDPRRPAGISATDDEVAASRDTARAVAEYLHAEGLGYPITALSGNGHLQLVPVDLPNDREADELASGFLRHLAARFDDERVKIDTSVANAARIVCLVGTLKVKGDRTHDRPHRRSELLHVPEQLVPVPSERLAALVPPTRRRRPTVTVSEGEGLAPGWVRGWLEAAGIAFREQPPDAAGIAWYGLEECPYHPDDGAPWQCGVGEAPDGRATGKCFHDRGTGKGWRDFRDALGLGPSTGPESGGGGDAGPRERAHDDLVLPPPRDPMAVAGRLADDRYRHADGSLQLRHWRGGFWEWLGPRWAELEDRALDAVAYRFTEHAVWLSEDGLVPWSPTRRKIGDLIDALRAVTHTDSKVTMPAWSTMARDDGDVSSTDVTVSCSNGLLDVTTRSLRPHHPAYFIGVSVPFPFEPGAPEPTGWSRFLHDLWPDDPEAIDALGEFFGYVISGRTDLHKILLIIGPTRAGKGVIARILKALVGLGNSAGPTLSSLGQNFGLQPLIGKPLAIISDARLGGAETSVVVERLLSISGEDMLTVDRKYKAPWTGTLPTRFLVISHELPRFGDASGAIANRFVVLGLEQSWLGREDPALTTKLLTELPGILAWALEGLDRLTARDRFTEPASSLEAKLTLADLVSPVSAFVRDRCTVGSGHRIACKELYRAWREWADDNGHRAGSSHVFGRNLRSVVPALRTIRPRDGDERERWYRGVCLGDGCVEHRGPLRTNGDIPPDHDSVVRNGPQPTTSSPQHDVSPRPDDESGPSAPGWSSDLRAAAERVWARDGFEWDPPPPDDDRGAVAEAQEGPWP